MDRIKEKEQNHKALTRLLDKLVKDFLDEEERFMSLSDYLGLIDQRHGDVKLLHDEHNLLACKVKPLPFANGAYCIQSGPFPIPDNFSLPGKRKSSFVSFNYSFVRTAEDIVLLVKGYLSEHQIYFDVRNILDIGEAHPYSREHFFLTYLQELTMFLGEELHSAPVYGIRDELFVQAVKLLSTYATGLKNFKESTAITQLLLCNTPSVHISEITREKGNRTILQVKAKGGGEEKELTLQLLEKSEIKRTDAPNSYRTNSSPAYNAEIDAYIVKAQEPDSGKVHYVFVSDLKRAFEANMDDILNGDKRLVIQVPFMKIGDEFVLKQSELNRKWPYKYTYLYDVDLLHMPTNSRRKQKK